jgi:hypothetical protein
MGEAHTDKQSANPTTGGVRRNQCHVVFDRDSRTTGNARRSTQVSLNEDTNAQSSPKLIRRREAPESASRQAVEELSQLASLTTLESEDEFSIHLPLLNRKSFLRFEQNLWMFLRD